MTGTLYSLIKPYIGYRHQSVNLVNNDNIPCYSLGTVKHSVPQGSVLGPLLFLFCVNDIMEMTDTSDNSNKCKLFLFADDTSLIITNPKTTNCIE